MGLNANLSSGSFLPPGTGSQLPSINTPPLSANVTPAQQQPAPGPAPSQQTTSPFLSQVLTNQVAPENMNQLIQNIPNIMSGLSPDEQDKFLQLLMSSDILNAMFADLGRPQTKDSFTTIVKQLFDSGMLNQVAQDKAVLPEEAQGALKDALQQKLVQSLVDLGAQMPKAQAEETASDNPNKMLNVPVSQPGVPNSLPQSVASLIANSLTQALAQNFSSSGVGGGIMNPQTAATPTQAQNQVQQLLTELITLGITNTPSGNFQLVVPPKLDPSSMQNLVAQLSLISEEFTKLGDMTSEQNLKIGTLSNFIQAPQTLLTLLKSIQPDDTTTPSLIKTWVDNASIAQNSILTRANDVYRDKFEFLKTMLLSTLPQLPSAVAKEQQIRQQLFEQVYVQAPALLNVFKLKDMVGVFGDDMERKYAALLFKFKRMLYNAAHEIVIVANGKPTFDYTEVGIFHPELAILAHKLETLLPESAEELTFEMMEVISQEIILTFNYIQEREERKIPEILKRHPRTLLYFLSIDSPIAKSINFPRSPELKVDPTLLASHIQRVISIIKKYQKNAEFAKYQPKVLEAFVDEAKYDPTSEITKHSLDIIHKAVADSSSFIDLE